ncbi:hypothetical protein [Pelagibius sp. Alg239-R121]|uniref:hypothetical protein n=1 Tax=Pelagibius sp. Alg239-R121 TaxID=2993448 RepID=UPI0024A75580|nr:hypothetical protein [Pelagibius sp. Alg239-R121]
MTLVIDLFKGKAGLAKTYWLWGVLGGLVVTIASTAISHYIAAYFESDLLYQNALYGLTVFELVWGIFVAIAIINAAAYKRKRGFWGWLASLLAVIGIFRSFQLAAVTFGLILPSWHDIATGIRFENFTLPMEIDEETTLVRMSTNLSDKSLTYHLDIDLPTLDDNSFDAEYVKWTMLVACVDLKSYLEGPVRKVVYEYKANDGTIRRAELLQEDCGF